MTRTSFEEEHAAEPIRRHGSDQTGPHAAQARRRWMDVGAWIMGGHIDAHAIVVNRVANMTAVC
jgi:hypothetical protein